MTIMEAIYRADAQKPNVYPQEEKIRWLSALDGSTNAKRINFISRLGYEVDENSVKSKDITIPMNFSDVYTEYNKLQKKAGFDLYKNRVNLIKKGERL